MGIRAAAAILVGLICTSCADVWAQSIGDQVARDLSKLHSYSGVYEETGFEEGAVTKTIHYAQPWLTRVEVVAPESHRGELFVFDGESIKMWWPNQQFGIRIRGINQPSWDEVRSHIRRITRGNLDAYAFNQKPGHTRVAGELTKVWNVLPMSRKRYRLKHTAYMHKDYSFPMRMDFFDGKSLWYGMQFSEIKMNEPIAADVFSFEFPKKSVVFEWNLADPGVTVEQAKDAMNFTLLSPKYLPSGHKISKVVVPQHCLPMAAMVMNRDATWLSVTQSRNWQGLVKPLGKAIKVGKYDATMSFLGGFTTITWAQGDTLLVLTSNLGFPDLIRIAESFESA